MASNKRCKSTVDFVDGMMQEGVVDTRNQHAVTIQAMRKIVNGVCPQCNNVFKGTTRKVFCKKGCGDKYRKSHPVIQEGFIDKKTPTGDVDGK